jgi:hypothetical protein
MTSPDQIKYSYTTVKEEVLNLEAAGIVTVDRRGKAHKVTLRRELRGVVFAGTISDICGVTVNPAQYKPDARCFENPLGHYSSVLALTYEGLKAFKDAVDRVCRSIPRGQTPDIPEPAALDSI